MTSIKDMSDKDLIIEARVMMIAVNGSEYLPELVDELRLRGLVDGDEWTDKANKIMGDHNG